MFWLSRYSVELILLDLELVWIAIYIINAKRWYWNDRVQEYTWPMGF